MLKIDVARLNALRPKPKPSKNPPEAVRTPSDDGIDSMEVDRVSTGRTLKKRKEKVEKSTDTPKEESVDSNPEDWENDYYNPTMAAYTRQNMHTEEFDEDYEEERATEYKNILDEQDKLLHHCSWKKNAPSIDRTSSPSIDTQPHQRNQKRASIDIAYYPLIDTYVDAT
ncbi:hypothetical protein F2Q70_00025350 [Brassica cretica]|uniref:Uncharacterized protein n=1 Tax=Brassica cretica TaxID=69181 RepID=A0A8S9LF61_BRACR|nr:hypothetical protein F2Q70_00025350 [Brassica cretica]